MNSKQIAIILALIGAAALLMQHQQTPQISEFEAWKGKHGLSYATEVENIYRERVFLKNLAEIKAHNAEEYRTYNMGLNHFSAMTHQEFAQTYLTLIAPEEAKSINNIDEVSVGDVDWVSQGAVTEVKDQGQCGSCWAFSTTGGLEGLSKLAYTELQSFSEQYLVDCAGILYGNQGCNGGSMEGSFRFVKAKGARHSDEYANYTAAKNKCASNSGSFKISGNTAVKTCTDLANAVTGRPVSVAVSANENWQKYAGGVMPSTDCTTSLNHGVLLVGISDASWNIKNSWSAGWGEKGFIRLARGNTCGVCNMASYPNK